MKFGPWTALAVAGALLGVAPAWAAPACTADPLGGRTLYLRGTFNSWNADEAQKFTWACNRWELVARVQGEHNFKIADEAWSADADFGRGAGDTLLPRGPEIKRRFDGVQRFTVTMTADTHRLQVQACPTPAPLGDTVLFLRGTPNNWAALDDYAFQYSCDAYYLNVKLAGRHEFKVADAGWKTASTFGEGNGNFAQAFDGEHTLRLDFDAGQPRLAIGPKTYADPAARAVTDPVALSLRFDSRSRAHKAPFGAVPAGTRIDYAVTALPGVEQLTLVIEKRRLEGNQEMLEYTELARLPMQRTVQGERERFSASHVYTDVAVHGHWFEAAMAGKVYVLQNNPAPVFWTREKGAGGLAAVADKPPAASSIRRFRQTVFDPAFKVPDWARDSVYYVVFPDRFRNGNPANDPQPGTERYHQHTVEKHADWNDRPFRPGSVNGKTDGSDAHFNNDFFGGDLAGVTGKLDYIKQLGANTVYMTPVFKASSNH